MKMSREQVEFKKFPRSWWMNFRVEEIWLGLEDFDSVLAESFWHLLGVWDGPVLANQKITIFFLLVIKFWGNSTHGIRALTALYLCNLDFLISWSNNSELTCRNLIEGAVIEIMFELHVDIFSMTRVFRIIEVVRSDEDSVHKLMWDSFVGHFWLIC